jgi:signal transduction histidine kinase
MIQQQTENRVLSDMAQSEIGRAAREHQRLELLEEAFRQIRIFCHDFSQPLMVLSGYLELINAAPYPRDSRMEGLEREVHRLSSIYQKLRDAVLHCRKQIELTDTPAPD